MSFLIDANVLSETTKPCPSQKVIDWLSTHERDIVVDPIVLGELSIGILALSPGRKRMHLEQWFDAVVTTIECVPWDAVTGRRWAELVVDLRKRGRVMPVQDSLIAATALTHELTIVTRNTRDFSVAGVKVLDPFL